MIPKKERQPEEHGCLLIVWYLENAGISFPDSPNYEFSQGKTFGDVCNLPVKTSTPVSVT